MTGEHLLHTCQFVDFSDSSCLSVMTYLIGLAYKFFHSFQLFINLSFSNSKVSTMPFISNYVHNFTA